ncbi:MAG: divergent polysaccharide deacetylase family protein [Sporomusaceae bacterium]|nr:divergent polysaccharide deacetylase family protein [Sporomusaceae bacterium]
MKRKNNTKRLGLWLGLAGILAVLLYGFYENQSSTVSQKESGSSKVGANQTVPATTKQTNPLTKESQGAKSGSARARIALIIDDFGYTSEPINEFAAISRPLTFSVLPNRPYSTQAAAKALQSGHQVMLHLPMEPLDRSQQSEAETVSGRLSDSEIQGLVRKDIQAIPGLIGVNNHQGSRATSDKRVMKALLAVLKEKQLFFVDSRTSSQSVAWELAKQSGVKTAANELFIDNQPDVESVKKQLCQGITLALKEGKIILIGHARSHTAQAIQSILPELDAQGIQLVFVSELVQ